MSKLEPKFDLVGYQTGQLIVISLSHKELGQGWMWLCRCSCGTSIKVSSGQLRAGRRTSCGCIGKKLRDRDLVGQVFGQLTVLEKAKIKRRFTSWRCQCSCGKRRTCTTSELCANRTVSCGCAIKRSSKTVGQLSGTLWTRIERGAAERGLEFRITQQLAWDLFMEQNACCALSGLSITLTSNPNLGKNTASLDRIDSSIGYLPDNIQWLHKIVNQMKNNLFQEDFLNLCQTITTHNSLLPEPL